MNDADEAELVGVEAEAQRLETIYPWIWGAIGVVVIAAFVAWAALWSGPRPPHPAPPLPVTGAPAKPS